MVSGQGQGQGHSASSFGWECASMFFLCCERASHVYFAVVRRWAQAVLRRRAPSCPGRRPESPGRPCRIASGGRGVEVPPLSSFRVEEVPCCLFELAAGFLPFGRRASPFFRSFVFPRNIVVDQFARSRSTVLSLLHTYLSSTSVSAASKEIIGRYKW